MVVSDEVVRRVQSRVGTTLNGKWQLARVLGIGGMAAVYAAVHRNQDRVAIKMLHPELSIHDVVRTRFLREGYVANSVGHAGAVRVHDDGVSEDGAAYLVMELLEGESLEDRRLRFGGRLPVVEVLAIADQLLETLAAAHDRGIVHRDIKPDNLFLTLKGILKVLDFGIARLRELSDPGSGTGAGIFMGTPAFMPPEQARSRWEEVDARSDVWSVGALLFTLLSGRFVHEAETATEQLVLAAREPAPPLRRVVPDAPFQVAALVDKALAFQPIQRWQDARSLHDAVKARLREMGGPHTLSARVLASGDPVSGDTATLLAADSRPATAGTPVGGISTPATPRREGSAWRRAGLGLAVAALLGAGLAAWLSTPGREPTAGVSTGAAAAALEVRPLPSPPPVVGAPATPAPSASVAPAREPVRTVSALAPDKPARGLVSKPAPTVLPSLRLAPSASAAKPSSNGSLLDRRF